MPTYRISGLCEAEDGERFLLGSLTLEADTEEEAERLAYDELWDERLRTTGCAWVPAITELDLACEFCGEEEAGGECDHCAALTCETCHGTYQCCDGEPTD